MLHDPIATAEERTAFMRARGAAGAAKKKEKQEAKAAAVAAEPVHLGTDVAILTFIETEVGALRAGGDDKRANAAARLAGIARDLLPYAKLKREFAELKELLAERHPELKSELRRFVVVK